MNQQINLYLPEFRKEKDRLTFVNMAVVVGGLVAILVFVSGIEYFGRWRLATEVAQRQAELEEARVRTNDLVDTYGETGEDQQLVEEVRQLDENLQGKRALLAFLDGRDMGNTAGFSEYLADLSRYHVDGLRLTSIDLRSGGDSVLLSGEVSRAEFVPLYLQNLRNGESYDGMTFETVRIAEVAGVDALDTRMEFDVATRGAR